MLYSKLGWNAAFKWVGSTMARRPPLQQPKWEPGGSHRLRERSSSELDWSKTEQGMILPLFSFPRRPWGRLHKRDRFISEPTQVDLPW